MATAAQVIKASLQEILVQASEAPLESDEYQDSIFILNTMMQALDADGIKLGWTDIATLADELTVPIGALMGIISVLAVRLAPTWGANVPPELIDKAKAGLETMRKLGVIQTDMQFPSTLSRGSGNSQYGWPYQTYYNGVEFDGITSADANV